MKVEPYLFFDGRCEEALAYYCSTLGAEIVALLRYEESPEPHTIPPGSAAKVMHANLRIGDTLLMASDGMCGGAPAFNGFSLALNAADDAEAVRLFGALADGGQVQMPLGKTFFASSFGMVADRYGVSWMVIAGAQ
jgi:PhnB protein